MVIIYICNKSKDDHARYFVNSLNRDLLTWK